MKLDTIINALMDEKRFHKMLDVANDAVIKTRPAFDEGGNAPENFASMYIVFFVKEAEYKYGKYTITAVSDYETGINWATLKKSLKDESGSWQKTEVADLPDEIADRLVRYGEMLVSHDCYKEAAQDEFVSEELDEVDEWAMQEHWDKDKGEYVSRLSEEAEYRDPRIYTSKYDSYFPCFA